MSQENSNKTTMNEPTENQNQSSKNQEFSVALSSGNSISKGESSSADHAVDPPLETCAGKNNKGVTWGVISEQGRRSAMEDAVAVVPAFLNVSCEQFGGCTAPGSKYATKESPMHFFGVFDGHGGSQVSNYCARRMNEVLTGEWVRECETNDWSKSWETALCTTFEKVDDVLRDEKIAPSTTGSTAVLVILSPCQIIAANCGDSRAILCGGTRAIPLTVDHKPNRGDEEHRITDAGGRILYWHGLRVEGILSMTRAIGDHNLKQWVISVPEVSVTTREKDDDFLVLASDGLWDVMTNEEVINFTRSKMREKRRLALKNNLKVNPAQLVAADLFQRALYCGSMDNISIIIVDLSLPRRRLQHIGSDCNRRKKIN